MPIVPKGRAKRLAFYEIHVPIWTAHFIVARQPLPDAPASFIVDQRPFPDAMRRHAEAQPLFPDAARRPTAVP